MHEAPDEDCTFVKKQIMYNVKLKLELFCKQICGHVSHEIHCSHHLKY